MPEKDEDVLKQKIKEMSRDFLGGLKSRFITSMALRYDQPTEIKDGPCRTWRHFVIYQKIPKCMVCRPKYSNSKMIAFDEVNWPII